MSQDFDERLKYGAEAEDEVYKYLLRKGWNLIPTVPFKTDKGQRFYCLDDDHPSTDTIAFKKGETRWIEVKHKTYPSSYSGNWTVGMDKYYFDSYMTMEYESGIPVFVFFLIEVSEHNVPFGMYHRSLKKLSETVDSRTIKTLYWTVSSLQRLNLYD